MTTTITFDAKYAADVENLLRSLQISKPGTSSRESSEKTLYIVCRVSSATQVGENHTSMDIQEQELRKYARDFYGDYNVVVVRITGSAFKRIPRQLTDLSLASGDILLVYRLDRLGRNIYEYVNWIRNLATRGVDFVSFVERISYSKNELEFIQGILDANKEAKHISDRVKDSVRYRRENGHYVGSCPYGKMAVIEDVNPTTGRGVRKLAQNPDEAKVIQIIKERFEGESSTLVAEYLNSKNIKKRGCSWSARSVLSVVNGDKKKTNKKKTEHFQDLIMKATKALQGRAGATRQSINKWILANYPSVDARELEKAIKKYIPLMIKNHQLLPNSATRFSLV